MQYIFHQHFALGDMLFLVGYAQKLIDEGHEVIWPIGKSFMSNMVPYFPEITFIEWHDDTPTTIRQVLPNAIYLDFQFAGHIVSGGDYGPNIMRDKYKMINEPIDTWKTFTWTRYKNKETELFTKLGLVDGEKYNLINVTFTNKNKIDIDINNNYKNIELSILDGYSMFDWYKVILNATTIHTVGTSVNYMMEVMDLKAEELHLYPRKPYERDCSFYNYLFEKNYIEHI